MSPTGPLLITGGAGFIGAALATALHARGHAVRVLDTARSDRLNTDAIPQVVGSVCNAETVAAAMEGCSAVLHFAAIANVHTYVDDPVTVLDTNILGTRTVLFEALRRGLPVLFASTSEAYGKNTRLLRPDGDTVLGPTHNRRWCYAVSKLAGEHYALGLRDQGLQVAMVRYFNVYGPLLDSLGTGRVVSKFLARIRDQQPLVLVDGGHAIRSFCYIDDAIAGTLAVFDALRDGRGDGQVYNVGSDDGGCTIAELAAHMARLSGHTAGVVHEPGVEHFGRGFEEIDRRVPDISGLRALGYTPKVGLEEGLCRTLEHWGLRARTKSGSPV